jgi:thioredoxin reductase
MDAPTAAEVDVVVVGGGPAGLAAALMLGRARRSVVVVDAGEPRNAPAEHLHGYLGSDGTPPADFLAIGRDEVRRYGVEVRSGRATGAERDAGGTFAVRLEDGGAVRGRRLLVAAGLVDELPAIPGVAERWGRDVLHCPYCHGWEVQDRPVVVIGTNGMGVHQASLFRQWTGDVTLVVHAGPGPTTAEREQLSSRGVAVVEQTVAEVVVEDDAVAGVRLATGAVVPARAVVVAPRMVARSEVLATLGLAPVDAPLGAGTAFQADATGATAIPGLYVAGNVADVRAQILQAAAAGSMAGAAINADLIAEDTARAVDATRRRSRTSPPAQPVG